MSQNENGENLLINFNNLTMSNAPSDDLEQNKSTKTETLHNCTFSNAAKNQNLCASQPPYKLLAESNNMDANNPFDHFDKQAHLLDDPFEIIEKAALISANSVAPNTFAPEVKMATLITIDSTMSHTSKGVLSSIGSQTTLCNETKLNDSVQNTAQMSATENISQKSVSSSSSPSSRSSITLDNVKNSTATSRLDVIAMGNVLTSGEENICSYNAFQKELEISRNLGKNDLFDDIWSTVPNLIDSQTEIDVASDTDNDIAELNIPMLKTVVPNSPCEKNVTADPINSNNKNSIETKALNRSNILEKLASIKQKIPASTDLKAKSGALAQTVFIHSGSQLSKNHDNETVKPATKYSPSVVHQQQQHITPNPDSLIKSLQKLVNQCDDKHKQMTAKYLLDNLSSILTKTDDKNRQPSKVFRRRPLSGKMKTSYGILKKSAMPADNKSNLKIRVSQSIAGQSRAQHAVNETRRTPSFI